MKNLIVTIFLILIIANLSAEIAVKSFRKLENDMTARIDAPKKDQNGDVCAIIKVVTTQTGFIWEPDGLGIVSAENKGGEYWLYVPYGAKRLTIKHSQLGVLRDYIYNMPIEKACVYEMLITTGKVITTVEEEISSQWLLIKAEPAKSMIYINEVFVKTGEYQTKLKPGKYTYRVEAPMYHAENGMIEITDTKRELMVNLKPAFGTAKILTTPEDGATVLIDGKELTKTTPCMSEPLLSGEHTIQIVKEMYQPLLEKITILEGQTLPFNFILAPNFAEITIKAPEKAQVVINNKLMGNGTWTGRLSPGIYSLEVQMDSYRAAKQDIELNIGDKKNFDLVPTPIFGSLDIMTTPAGANIIINGNNYGTTPNTINKLLIGNYKIQLIKNGFETVFKNISISENKLNEIIETLTENQQITVQNIKPKTKINGIRFTSSPSGAYLLRNGSIVGVTPFETNKLPDGEYTFEIRCENFEASYKKAVVNKAKCQSYYINLYGNKSSFECKEDENEEIIKQKTVTITTIPEGAFLLVDGSFVSKTPCSVDLKEGTHNIEFRRVGYNSVYKAINVDSKEKQYFKFTL